MNRQSQWLFETPSAPKPSVGLPKLVENTPSSREISPPPRPAFVLVRTIPDDPNYRKYVPINYRLNAKQIVGEVAQDLSSKGKSAHFWVDLAHWGIAGAEIAFEGSLLVAGLAIAGPLLAAGGLALALGAPYVEAAEKIAADWSARGFSRGVVMGTDLRTARLLMDYFGRDYISPNQFFPRGRSIAIANYRVGLLVGYAQGRMLSPNQRTIFWRDLGHRMGDQTYRGASKQWQKRQWIDWYINAAAVFWRDHLTS